MSAPRSMSAPAATRSSILSAAKEALLESGFAGLSTRRVADAAGVPLSQIHYHFRSKQNLVLSILDEENAVLLARQQRLYGAEIPVWRQWEQACDFLDEDLESGYVRVLQEMTAAGWSNDDIAAAVRRDLTGWFDLLGDAAAKVADRIGGLGPFTPAEIAALVGGAFLGIETMILLDFEGDTAPARSALRKVGILLRRLEESRAGAGT